LHAAQALGLIALFVTGAAGRPDCAWPRAPIASPAAAAEALLLAAAALCDAFGLSNVAVAAIVLAMGWKTRIPDRWRRRLGLTTSPARWEGRPTGRGGADRRRALGLGAEFAAVGGDGDGCFCAVRRLSLDQSRRDLVAAGAGAGVKRDRCRGPPTDSIDSERGLRRLERRRRLCPGRCNRDFG